LRATELRCLRGPGKSDQVTSAVTSPIVSFSNPPVSEVVAGVAFTTLGAEGVATVSGFWRDVARDAFPDFQVQPPYTPIVEQFSGSPGRPAIPLAFQMISGYPPPRFWAIGDDGQYLLQLQSDWFACNWRRVRPEDEYDRWDSRRAAFREWYQRLAAYVDDRTGKTLDPLQCEVTYINNITPTGKFQAHADFGEVFNLRMSDVAYPPEQFSTSVRYSVPSPSDPDRQVGRLHVDINAALDQKNQSIYVMNLTVRGEPEGKSVEHVLSFLDLGRRVIDEAFVSLTTAEMQAEWGRLDD
jgi:uncharacterized protein (TIGR04255 family)